MSFTSISLSLCFFLLILLTLSFTEQKFWIKIPAYQYFFHRSCLWYYITKSDCLTQSLPGFLICYLLWVLQFCNLHLGLYFILSSYLRRMQVFVSRFFFFFVYGCPVVPALFVEMTVFLTHYNAFVSLPKISWTIFMWVYFWALYSVLYSFISNTLS